ncbi:hypothetical protein F4804DRAFT_297805 [Jackrogersella minutella]|nr:hypothetical protein F4804DRAFT_297805 [Jackrogersella minutella]
MAPRPVIADSDDEDGGDFPLSPLREDIEVVPPEIEPLSPQAPDAQTRISGTTDQSFFASVYDEQQGRALEQSQLIERIVRQSQKASGSSSGEVSLPAKGKGKKPDASSATDVTSPTVVDRPRNRPSLFSDGASGVTTPRRSAPGEWDVPSSAEGPDISRGAKSSRGKKEKSYGKQIRTPLKTARASAATEMFIGNDDAAHGDTVGDMAVPDEIRRRKISLHDSVLRETPTTANFYISQSHLTTMQKLEYQKVTVPQHGYSTLPVSLPNPKSSGMSTIAYSTPSRYASSSGPPLPWERDSAADTQPNPSSDVIDIMSSPDIIAADHDYTNLEMKNTPHMRAHTVAHEAGTPTGASTQKSPRSKKRKKRPHNTQDEDELVQNEHLDPKTTNNHEDNHKRRRRNELNTNSLNQQDDEDVELVINPQEEIIPQAMEYGGLPLGEAHKVDEFVPEIPATEPPIPIPLSAPNPKQLEAQPDPQPKKRGRKKKQTTSEQIIQDEPSVVNEVTPQALVPAGKGAEVQAKSEKPRKKRGQPRKSDPAKPEIPIALEPDQGDELDPERIGATEKPKKNKQAQMQEEKSEKGNGPVLGGDVSPLKEISNNNPKTPSQISTSATEGVPARSVAESSVDPNLPPKSREKGSSTPKPTPTSSQPKVPYRVGLSKRTRIASLLKSIKR